MNFYTLQPSDSACTDRLCRQIFFSPLADTEQFFVLPRLQFYLRFSAIYLTKSLIPTLRRPLTFYVERTSRFNPRRIASRAAWHYFIRPPNLSSKDSSPSYIHNGGEYEREAKGLRRGLDMVGHFSSRLTRSLPVEWISELKILIYTLDPYKILLWYFFS